MGLLGSSFSDYVLMQHCYMRYRGKTRLLYVIHYILCNIIVGFQYLWMRYKSRFMVVLGCISSVSVQVSVLYAAMHNGFYQKEYISDKKCIL